MKVRTLYYEIALKVFTDELMLSTEIDAVSSDLTINERRRLTNLLHLYFRHFPYVEQIYINKVDKKVDSQNLETAVLLLCAGVEYLYLDKSVSYAVVNDYVEVCKKTLGFYKSKYINAMLRKFSSLDKEQLLKEEANNLEISHPEWIIDKYKSQFGDKYRDFLKFNQTIPEMFVRVNRTKITPAKLSEMFEKEGIVTAPVDGFPDFLKVVEGNPIHSELLKEGYYYIQDIANSIPVKLLDPQKGEKILDLCTAPAGKATYIQELTNDKVTLYLNDISQKKRVVIKHNFKRLGLNFKKLTNDPAEKYHGFEEFDRILIDVPCSGSGNFRRHPESRWNKEEEDLKDLVKLQKAILDNAKIYVRKGGVIVYSTCSVFDEENIEVVRAFLKENEDYEIYPHVNDELDAYKYKDGSYFVNPAVHKTEGAFCVKLVRIR